MLALTTTIWAGEAGWAGGWGGPWWLLIPLVWIAIASAAVWIFGRRRNASPLRGSGAVEILAARFARGEIDTDEYRQRLDELKGLR